MMKVKFTDGCPNGCEYCYEPKKERKYYPVLNFEDHEIQILDMNFLSNPNYLEILKSLPKGKYELVCGFDYRRFNQEIADLFKKKGFVKLRWAWDYNFSQQKTHRKNFINVIKSGLSSRRFICFYDRKLENSLY